MKILVCQEVIFSQKRLLFKKKRYHKSHNSILKNILEKSIISRLNYDKIFHL